MKIVTPGIGKVVPLHGCVVPSLGVPDFNCRTDSDGNNIFYYLSMQTIQLNLIRHKNVGHRPIKLDDFKFLPNFDI